MGERRRLVATVTAATVLLLGACGSDDAGDALPTVPTSAADTLATTPTTATTSSTPTTSTTPTTSAIAATVPPTTATPTTASPANTTAATAAVTTAATTAVTTAPETTAGALVLSWTSSGPPAVACFEPGETVPDLVVERAPDSEPLNFQVDIIDSQFEPLTVAPLLWSGDFSDDRNVFTFTVDEAAPRPWSVELRLDYSAQGTQVFVTDEPDVFRWSFEDACG